MQIIQSIRDKGAAIVIVVIALSLIGFILMDARQGSNNLFSSMATDVGKVNGEKIELADFSRRVKEADDMQAQRSGQRPSGIQTYQSRENMWNQVVAEKIFFAEAKKLGIEFTAKELSYILLSNDQQNPFLQEQSLKDSITGKLDISKAQAALNNIKKLKGEQRDGVNAQIVNPLKLSTTVAKYSGLLNASVYYPTWMKDKEAAESSNFANISYVNIPYSEIADSTIKVTDEDINAYVNKNPLMFKQEGGRNISYVAFSQSPSKEDSMKTTAQLEELKTAFQTDSNSKAFVARNASTIDFSDDYAPKSKITAAVADTLTRIPVGTVYGPYVDKTNYILAKVLGTKSMPDSASARHILIGVNDPRSGEAIMPDSIAKKRADSIYNAILGGANFAALASQFSTDMSNKDKAGDLGTFGYGAMVPEFNEFCFTKSPGSRGVVKTQFGYHIIELQSQKDFKEAYKIAYIGREIMASEGTINKASLDATKASAEKNKEALEKYVTKNGLSLTQVPNMLKENDFSVGALQDARGLIRWAFEAKKGAVSEPFSIGDQFVVAVVDKVNTKGLQDAASARSGTETTIRNKKKAEQIIKKLGTNPTMESAAAAFNKQVMQAGADSSLTFSAQIVNGLGIEPKLIGASFNKTFQSKVSPVIEGSNGVYLLKVNSIQAKTPETPEAMNQQAINRKNTLRSQLNNWYEGLKNQADIVDHRSKHF
jgi:peptidyl-prolyl cis-trans isomerase D